MQLSALKIAPGSPSALVVKQQQKPVFPKGQEGGQAQEEGQQDLTNQQPNPQYLSKASWR